MDRKSVGPLGSRRVQVSPVILSSLKGPFQPAFVAPGPSRQTSTSELRERLWTASVDGPLRVLRALLTCSLALILTISSIAFRIATTLCVIKTAGASEVVIRGKAPNTSSVGIRPSGPVESL